MHDQPITAMKHVVMFSGGVGSWAAAKRVAERHGTDNLVLLFADVLMEDADTYRFLGEAARNVGGEFVRACEGRDPWQLFFDERMMGNSGSGLCSRMLKREQLDKWLLANSPPDETIVYLGIDWTEKHRFYGDRKTKGAKDRYAALGYRAEAPMCDAPLMSKCAMLKWLDGEGIKRPRLYDLEFPHANCGGFCVKAGHDHFAHLLKVLPDVYAHHEAKEQEFRQLVGKDVAILRDRRGGATRPLTMKEFRERVEANVSYLDYSDGWGGCGCAIE
jgi:hypothetical protein